MRGAELGKKPIVFLKDFLFFIIGGALYAVSVKIFTAPNQIAPGGVTGLSTVANYLFGVPIGTLSFLLNIPIFAWAVSALGFKTVAKTIAATFLMSASIDLFGLLVPGVVSPYMGNPLLAAICGGLLEGAGLSMVFLRGGTTGGSDMVARLLGVKVPHISMGKLIFAVDCVVILISAFAYRSLESALYAGITIFISSRVIDAILYGTDAGTGKFILIISEKNEEIARDILEDIERGVTRLQARGGYSGRDNEVLLCAVRRYEVAKVKEIIHAYDPDAFVLVGEAGEIRGEGFRRISLAAKRKKKKSTRAE